MATKYITVSGKIAWAHHLFEPDEFRGDKKWKVDFYPDVKSKQTITDAGIMLRYKAGEFGMYIRPARPTQKMFKKGLVEFDPPEVTDKDGKKWEGGIIGNGSEATLRLSVFDTVNGPGHRLEAVRIDSLVEYHSPEDSEEASEEQEGLPF